MIERGVVEIPSCRLYLSLFRLFLPGVALLLAVTTLSFCQSGILPPSSLQRRRGGGEGEEFVETCWWESHGSGAAASGAPAKPLGATLCHPVAAGLWDTRQVAAKHLIATPPIKGEEDEVCKDIQDDDKKIIV